jgi:hypothetical protein
LVNDSDFKKTKTNIYYTENIIFSPKIKAETLLSTEIARQIALSLPGAEEKDHFGKPSFRVNNRIFATVWENENRVMVKLPIGNQAIICASHDEVFHPVPGGWGRMGCTFVELDLVNRKALKDALTIAWTAVTSKSKKKSRPTQ